MASYPAKMLAVIREMQSNSLGDSFYDASSLFQAPKRMNSMIIKASLVERKKAKRIGTAHIPPRVLDKSLFSRLAPKDPPSQLSIKDLS